MSGSDDSGFFWPDQITLDLAGQIVAAALLFAIAALAGYLCSLLRTERDYD